MSNHEYMPIDGSLHFFQDQETIQTRMNEKTAVFENLEGSSDFARNVMRKMQSPEGQITNISISGTPGVGKETVGGHVINYISEDKRLNTWLKSHGKHLEEQYVSFGDVIQYAQRNGILKNTLGALTPQDYFVLSVLLHDVVVAMNEEPVAKDAIRLNLIENPAVLEDGPGRPPGGRGAYALEYLGREKRDSFFTIAVVGNQEVRNISYQLRSILEQPDISEGEVQNFFKENGIVWEGFEFSKIPQYLGTFGRSSFVEAQANDLLVDMVQARIKGDVFPEDFIDPVDPMALERDPVYRARVEKEYYRGWLPKKYHVDPKNLLVAENTRLDNVKTVHFYRDVVQKHKIDVAHYHRQYASIHKPH
jgi:hypothetical protein